MLHFYFLGSFTHSYQYFRRYLTWSEYSEEKDLFCFLTAFVVTTSALRTFWEKVRLPAYINAYKLHKPSGKCTNPWAICCQNWPKGIRIYRESDVIVDGHVVFLYLGNLFTPRYYLKRILVNIFIFVFFRLKPISSLDYNVNQGVLHTEKQPQRTFYILRSYLSYSSAKGSSLILYWYSIWYLSNVSKTSPSSIEIRVQERRYWHTKTYLTLVSILYENLLNDWILYKNWLNTWILYKNLLNDWNLYKNLLNTCILFLRTQSYRLFLFCPQEQHSYLSAPHSACRRVFDKDTKKKYKIQIQI